MYVIYKQRISPVQTCFKQDEGTFIYRCSWPLYVYLLYCFETRPTNLRAFTELHLLTFQKKHSKLDIPSIKQKGTKSCKTYSHAFECTRKNTT
jgi:hypothetical protein